MTFVRDYLMTVDRDQVKARTIIEATVSELRARRISLIEVVESLGEYINDEDPSIRAKAIDYLSRIVEHLPPEFLTRQQINVLCQFMCDRIEDTRSIKGLQALIVFPRFTAEMAISTFRATVSQFQDLQTYPQPRRFQVLSLLDLLLQNRREPLRQLGSSCVVGITDLVSGEKDPRNLMVVFSFLRVVIFEWDIRGYSETLFESVFCYFPITFKAPLDDPYGITAQDLKSRLSNCLAASAFFAPYIFPQLIDKLDSSAPNVKRDVLDTMAKCIESYDMVVVSEYSVSIWDALKYELFNGQDEEMMTDVLTVLGILATRLSLGPQLTQKSKPLAVYLHNILSDCNERLQEPQQKQAKVAGRIIKACAASSIPSLSIVAADVIPSLITLHQDAATIDQRMAILESILCIVSAATGFHRSDYQSIGLNPLKQLKDDLFQMFAQSLMGTPATEVSFRCVALQCLHSLCLVSDVLESSEIGLVVQYLNEIALTSFKDDSEGLTSAAIDSLVILSAEFPSFIVDITFPAFMARLPDSTPKDESYVLILEALSRVSSKKDISDTLVRRMFNRLDTILHDQGSLYYCKAIFSALIYTLKQQDLANDHGLVWKLEKTINLILKCAKGSTNTDCVTLLNDTLIMEMLGRLTCILVRPSSVELQHTICEQAYSLLFPNTLLREAWSAQNLNIDQTMIIVSTYMIAAVQPKISLPFSAQIHPKLVKALIHCSESEDQQPIRLSVLRHITLLINKFGVFCSSDDLHNLLFAPESGLLDTKTLSSTRLRVGIWISKAYLLRLIQVEEIMERYFQLIEHPVFGLDAAKGLAIILRDDEIITKDNGAVVRRLMAQRIFQICVATISHKFWTVDPSTQRNYLTTLSGVLGQVDTKLVMLDSERLLPLLLQALDMEQQEVKAAVLRTLEMLMLETPRIVESHVSNLLNRFLIVAKSSGSNREVIRLIAIRCLRELPSAMSGTRLLPYRQNVLKEILGILDDPKRDVRKGAVDCKAAWVDLDEATANEP